MHQDWTTQNIVVTGAASGLAVSDGSALRTAAAYGSTLPAPSPGLPRSTPEAQGIASADILGFVQAADQQVDTMNSFMLVRHGHVVSEGWWAPYDAETPHILYSLSKSFTSTAVGLAISDGKLSLDDQVLKFFPEDAPPQPSDNLRAMRVRDLLRMATGNQTEAQLRDATTKDEPWTRIFLAHPVPFKPGTHFLYNSPGTYMLSAIVQKVTGMTVLDYLQPRLFEPLGFKNPTWVTSPQGISAGAWGLMARTEEMARFGQLYLQKGEWQGRQLVPRAWVEEATSLKTANGSAPTSDWDQGYGYQFWRCRHNAFRGDGAFGQYCIVIPDTGRSAYRAGRRSNIRKVVRVSVGRQRYPGCATGLQLRITGTRRPHSRRREANAYRTQHLGEKQGRLFYGYRSVSERALPASACCKRGLEGRRCLHAQNRCIRDAVLLYFKLPVRRRPPPA